MVSKFRNKYRSDSVRMQNWNYGWDAAYFITISTKNREFYFGNIVEGVMILNDIGEIVQAEWLKTFDMRPDMNLIMGEFVVMPNHFHAIIGIGENEFNTKRDSVYDPNQGTGAMHCASTASGSTASGSTASGSTASGSTASGSASKSQNHFGPQIKKFGCHNPGI